MRSGIWRVILQDSIVFWSGIFLLLQQQLTKLMSCVVTLYRDIFPTEGYIGNRIQRLQFQGSHKENGATGVFSSNFGDINTRALNKDTDSIVDDGNALTQFKAKPSVLDCLYLFKAVNYSPINMAELQRDDPVLRALIQWLQEGHGRPSRDEVMGSSPSLRNFWFSYDLFVLIDGVLFRKYIIALNEDILLLVVPCMLQREVLIPFHESIKGEHLGLCKTYSNLRLNYYWYKMKQTVQLHIKTCDDCASRKRPNNKLRL